MGEFELTPTAQHWFNAVLLWIGFGTVAGLLAKAFVPAQQVSGAVTVVVMGVLGSVVGPLALGYFLKQAPNPISPIGLLAAAGGALLLMIAWRVATMAFARPPAVDDDDEGEGD